jgi:hypothetical protein
MHGYLLISADRRSGHGYHTIRVHGYPLTSLFTPAKYAKQKIIIEFVGLDNQLMF